MFGFILKVGSIKLVFTHHTLDFLLGASKFNMLFERLNRFKLVIAGPTTLAKIAFLLLVLIQLRPRVHFGFFSLRIKLTAMLHWEVFLKRRIYCIFKLHSGCLKIPIFHLAGGIYALLIFELAWFAINRKAAFTLFGLHRDLFTIETAVKHTEGHKLLLYCNICDIVISEIQIFLLLYLFFNFI